MLFQLLRRPHSQMSCSSNLLLFRTTITSSSKYFFHNFRLNGQLKSNSKKLFTKYFSNGGKDLKDNVREVHSESRARAIWRNFISHKEMPPRYTFQWYREMVLICTVFGITGSSTMIIVRPAVSDMLGIKGSLKDGPWSYRICSIVIMTPIYSILLVVVGTIFGRHAYFRHFSVKMFSRFGIPPEQIDANYLKNAEKFKKW